MRSRPQHDSAEPQRVFVALWPSPEVSEELGALAATLAMHAPHSRAVPATHLHLTLAFIGTLESGRVAPLARRLGEGAGTPFDWRIDRIGYFDRACVVWAGGRENESLLVLARNVRGLLDAAAVVYDRKPFVPHVTLLRDVRRWKPPPATSVPAIVWRCGAPTLVRSTATDSGVVYTPVSV